MKLHAFTRALTPTAWLVTAGLVVVIIVAAWWLIIGGPANDRKNAALARAEATLASARTEAASEAAIITDAAHGAATASEALSRESANVIQSAPGADVRLDPDLNRIARERLCRRVSYAQSPQCLDNVRPR